MTSANDVTKTNEFLRRRKLRLQQVWKSLYFFQKLLNCDIFVYTTKKIIIGQGTVKRYSEENKTTCQSRKVTASYKSWCKERKRIF